MKCERGAWMTLSICVDSGIAIKLVVQEPDSALAEAIWQSWLRDGQLLVAPPLFSIEITAVLRKLVYREILTVPQGQEALNKALAFDVTLLDNGNLHQQAWNLAAQLNRPTAYDAHYLALAQQLGCDFWTADRRLYNAAHQTLPWVHWLGNFTPPAPSANKPTPMQ